MGFWPFYRSEPDAATTEPDIDPGASFFKIPADKHGGAADGPATLATLASLLQPFEGPTIPAKARTDPGERVRRLASVRPTAAAVGPVVLGASWERKAEIEGGAADSTIGMFSSQGLYKRTSLQ